MLAPIIIFAFNRPDNLKRLIGSLSQNPLFNESKVIVFIDGPRKEQDVEKIKEVVKIASNITDDIRRSKINKGLGPSIISGVTSILNEYGKAIVLEDDLYLMPGFLKYMNSALDKYQEDVRILSICGYGLKLKRPSDCIGDVFLSNRSSSWGWATWKDRWDRVDWEVKDFESLSKDKKRIKRFNRGGSDMYSMLSAYIHGKNKSWAIRFCYHQFNYNLYSVHPFRSLVANEGFGIDATNCKQKYSRYKIILDDTGNDLLLPNVIEPNEKIIKEMASYNSIPIRIYSRIRRMLNI